MRCAIGLDLGGSSAKVALVADTGEVLVADHVAIPETMNAADVLNPIASAVDRLRYDAAKRAVSPIAVGCGFSGYLDNTRTTIEQNNTPALDGFALAPWLYERFGLPVALDNDACVAALAETRLAHMPDKHRVLFVTVGSGIGVVLVVDGVVVRVMKGVTNDASHIIVNFGSQHRCPVGCSGCLETVASARAIARAGIRAAQDGSSSPLKHVLAETGEITGLDVSYAASSGDAAAREILARAGQWLGVGLASWACTYAPDIVLLGGAVAEAGEAWLQGAIDTMRGIGMPLFVDRLDVATATLGNRAGVIGAALMALQEADRRVERESSL
ncbi:MAG: hypothetical protein JWO42_2107 [Chloroflexi bacterium]|nr:hypothetical protein [Chloroflexota bacterium]